MKCNNCGCSISENNKFCPNCGNEISKQKTAKSKTLALISLFLILIPVIVIVYAAHMDSGCVGGCAGGWIVIAYVWFAGIPVGVCALVLGISSYMLKKNILALIDILLGTLQMLAIISLLS